MQLQFEPLDDHLMTVELQKHWLLAKLDHAYTS